MTALRQKYIRDLAIRGRAERTQEAYTSFVADLARHYHKSPDLLSYDEVADWLFHLVRERKLSSSSVNSAVNAVRFLYGVTLGRGSPRALCQGAADQARDQAGACLFGQGGGGDPQCTAPAARSRFSDDGLFRGVTPDGSLYATRSGRNRPGPHAVAGRGKGGQGTSPAAQRATAQRARSVLAGGAAQPSGSPFAVALSRRRPGR